MNKLSLYINGCFAEKRGLVFLYLYFFCQFKLIDLRCLWQKHERWNSCQHSTWHKQFILLVRLPWYTYTILDAFLFWTFYKNISVFFDKIPNSTHFHTLSDSIRVKSKILQLYTHFKQIYGKHFDVKPPQFVKVYFNLLKRINYCGLRDRIECQMFNVLMRCWQNIHNFILFYFSHFTLM